MKYWIIAISGTTRPGAGLTRRVVGWRFPHYTPLSSSAPSHPLRHQQDPWRDLRPATRGWRRRPAPSRPASPRHRHSLAPVLGSSSAGGSSASATTTTQQRCSRARRTRRPELRPAAECLPRCGSCSRPTRSVAVAFPAQRQIRSSSRTPTMTPTDHGTRQSCRCPSRPPRQRHLLLRGSAEPLRPGSTSSCSARAP